MARTKNAFGDVRELNVTAKDLLAKYGRTAMTARETVIEDPGQREIADKLVDLIDKDLREYTAEIDRIENLHSKWPAVPKREAHYQNALSVGGQYVAVIDNISQTMSDPALDLVDILNNHGKPTAAQEKSE